MQLNECMQMCAYNAALEASQDSWCAVSYMIWNNCYNRIADFQMTGWDVHGIENTSTFGAWCDSNGLEMRHKEKGGSFNLLCCPDDAKMTVGKEWMNATSCIIAWLHSTWPRPRKAIWNPHPSDAPSLDPDIILLYDNCKELFTAVQLAVQYE